MARKNLIDLIDDTGERLADIHDDISAVIKNMLRIMGQLDELRKIHTPWTDHRGVRRCRVCAADNYRRLNAHASVREALEWPCPTLKAFGITEELGESGDG